MYARIASALLLAATALPAIADDNLRISLVTELHRNEPYDGHLFHDGHLFVTKSKQYDGEKHKVVIYDAAGQNVVQTVELEHTGGFIYPYSANAVYVVGKSYTDQWKTHYTVLTRNGNTYSARTWTLPVQYNVNEATGTQATGLYFTEPGEAAILRGGNAGSLSNLGVTISGPGPLQLDGDTLWAVEKRSFQLGDEGLAKINVRTGAMTQVFATTRPGLMDVQLLAGYPWVAGSEVLSGQVIFVDKQTNELAHAVDVGGEPRGMAQLGGCLVVTSEQSKTVSFISLWGDAPALLKQWDLTPAGDMLKKPRHIEVDPAAGRVFVRSNYTCPTCMGTQSSVWVAEELDGATKAACLAAGN